MGVKMLPHTFPQSSSAVWEHWEAAFHWQSGRASWRQVGLRAKQPTGGLGVLLGGSDVRQTLHMLTAVSGPAQA